METHRYVRRLGTSGNGVVDIYNPVAASYPSTPEYWTNGTTTLIVSQKVGFPPNHQGSDTSDRPTVSARHMKNPRQINGHLVTTPSSTTNRAGDHVVRNSLIAGSLSGITSTLACHPFDVIRTKLQTAAMNVQNSPTTPAATPQSSIQLVSHTLKHGGFRALYTGLALPLAAQAVYKGTIFAVNNITKSFLMDFHTRERLKTGTLEPYSLSLCDLFFCGFMGGAVNAALFVTPVEYVRNQLIAQHSKHAAGEKLVEIAKGPMDVVGNTMRSSSGMLGLWRGVSVTVARDSIGCGCFFYAMEWTQRRHTSTDGSPPSMGLTIVSGALAGLAFWVAALPLDSVKTWVQSDMANSATEAVRSSLREQGVARTMDKLLSGWPVAYSRGIPSAAITVTTYQFCYHALKGDS